MLNYGSLIYGLAPPTHLALLDPIQNATIRIRIGAFHTSSALSLCAESGYPPLRYRRLNLTASLLTSILQLPNTLVHDILFNSLCHRLTYRKSFTDIRYFLNHTFFKNFHFHCLPPIAPSLPPWAMTPPNIVFKLCKYPKNFTIATVYRSLFLEILNSFPGAILCFTDESKIGDRTGFAYSISNQIFASRHRNSASILTVELQAIFQCLEKILSTPFPQPDSFLIVSDSLSAMSAISNVHSTHPLVTRIHTLLTTLSSSPLHNIYLGPQS